MNIKNFNFYITNKDTYYLLKLYIAISQDVLFPISTMGFADSFGGFLSGENFLYRQVSYFLSALLESSGILNFALVSPKMTL